MSKNTTDEITYASVKAISGGDYSALTIRIGDKLFTFIGEESEAIEALISNREKLLLDRVETEIAMAERMAWSDEDGSHMETKVFQNNMRGSITTLRKELGREEQN